MLRMPRQTTPQNMTPLTWLWVLEFRRVTL